MGLLIFFRVYDLKIHVKTMKVTFFAIKIHAKTMTVTIMTSGECEMYISIKNITGNRPSAFAYCPYPKN